MRLYSRIIVLLILLVTYLSFSQTSNGYLFTSRDGLSQNSATAIIQDQKGFIWIGTKDGLNRYDGVHCKIFRRSDKQNSINHNSITCLLEDSEENIWIGTAGGLNKFLTRKETFITFPDEKNKQATVGSTEITCLLEDNNKTLWVGTKNGLRKISYLNNSVCNQITFSESSRNLNNKAINCLFQDSDKNIWVGTDDGELYKFSCNNSTLLVTPIEIKKDSNNKLYPVTSICELKDNRIIVGTSGNGVLLFDKVTGKLIPQTHKEEEDYIYKFVSKIKWNGDECVILTNRILYSPCSSGNKIIWYNNIVPAPGEFLIDRSGITWIGSNGQGIVKIIPIRERFRTITKETDSKNGFVFSSIRSILNFNGSLLVGGYTGLLITKNFHSEKPVWKMIDFFKEINVYSLAVDPLDENILWVGAEDAGLYKYNLNSGAYKKYGNESPEGNVFKFADNVYDILMSRNGNIYFGTQAGMLKYNRLQNSFTKYAHIPGNPNSVGKGKVKTLCEDSFGNIWIGTTGSGISIYDPKKDNFIKLENFINGKDGIPFSGLSVNIIVEDTKKNIWIGTADGLYKIISQNADIFSMQQSNRKTETKIYRTEDGLANNCVYAVQEDSKGCLWLSTNLGLSMLNPGNETFTNYDESYGLQSNEFNTGAYFKRKDGELFFGGIKGITSFYPKDMVQNNYAPRTVLTEFRKFNKPVKLAESITYSNNLDLTYEDHFFSFNFIMPEYVEPARHKFAYKLSGFDERWIYLADGERSATFTSIPPGEYTFWVKGTNSDGVWSSQVTSLDIVIHPAYWQTWWFKLAVVSVISFVIFLLYRSRINRLKIEKEIQQDLTNQLINSHEEERKNISYELHDDLGQNLLVVKNKLLLAKRDNNYEESIESVVNLLDHSIQDVSNISHLLHPSELEALGLTQAIEAMLYRVESATKIKIENNLQSVDEYFQKEEMINLFRIVQEALNNIIKHSKATNICINKINRNGTLIIEIIDNGIGFDNSNSGQSIPRPHIGLKGMMERALMLNGKLKINSVPNKGTTIRLEFKNRNNIQ